MRVRAEGRGCRSILGQEAELTGLQMWPRPAGTVVGPRGDVPPRRAALGLLGGGSA